MNTMSAVRELHTSDVQAPCQAADCSHLQQARAEDVWHGACTRPFSATLSADLDWVISTIEQELALAQPNAQRLRLLREHKALLEGAI